MDVTVVGSCMIDLISYAPRLPQSGETLHGSKFSVGFGGKGANQCVAARKLGCSSLLVARLGADSFGRDYLLSLDTLGIDSTCVKATQCSSGMAQIIVSDNGENQIVIVAGANDKLCVSDVRDSAQHIRTCRVLITQMEVPVETTLEALSIKASAETGISIFNAAPAQPSLLPQLYSLPTIFCVNETEVELLTGHSLASVQDACQAVTILQSRGCKHVIITIGRDGAVYAAPGQKAVHIPSTSVDVVDTTGAGDAFIGALAFFLAKRPNLDIPEAVRRACAIAAMSVQHRGTQTSFPELSQLPAELID